MGIFGKKMLWEDFSREYYDQFQQVHSALEDLRKEICIDGKVKEGMGSPFHNDDLGKLGQAFGMFMIYAESMINSLQYHNDKLDFGELLKHFEKLVAALSKHLPRIHAEYSKLESEGKISKEVSEYSSNYFLETGYNETQEKGLYKKFTVFLDKMNLDPKNAQETKDMEMRNLEVLADGFTQKLEKNNIRIENAFLYLKIVEKLKDLVRTKSIKREELRGLELKSMLANSPEKGAILYSGQYLIEKIFYLEDDFALLITYNFISPKLYDIKGEIEMNGISAGFEISDSKTGEGQRYHFLTDIGFYPIDNAISEVNRKANEAEEKAAEQKEKNNSADIAKML